MDAAPRIVTGQQIGAGWTPALSVAKALAALAEARRTGGEAVFWMADEDHDRGEVASVTALRGERLLRHRFCFDAPQGTAAGWLPWTPAHQAEAEALWGPLPQAPEPTLRGHFLALGAPLWQRGLRPFSPVDPARRDSLDAELQRWRRMDLESLLMKEAERRRAAGEVPPLDPHAQSTWFALDPRTGARRRLAPGEPLPAKHWLSPGALVRPLLQSLALRPAAVVLGPAERAYWRLLGPLWEAVGLEPPRILPRPSVFVVPPGLSLDVSHLEVIRLGRWETFRGSLPPLPSHALDDLSPLPAWGADLGRGFVRELAHTRERLLRLDRRLTRAHATQVLGLDPERLRQRLFPLGQPQERVLPGCHWLASEVLLDRMLEALASSPDTILVEAL